MQDKGIISFNEHFPLFKGKYKNIVKGSKKEIIHNLKAEYIPLFINTAVEVVPEIALGVYLQCFGGLRNSGVSAIEYENISFYFQSVMQPKTALIVSMARGIVLCGILVFVLPALFGAKLLWWVMPVTELAVAIYTILCMVKSNRSLALK